MPKKVSLFIVVILLLALAVGMLAACTGENEDKKIVSIEFADGEWQTNYYLGQLFEPCEATITYDDGTTEVITVTAEMIRGFGTSKIGEYDITIDINGFTKTLTITVGYPEEEKVVPPQLYLWNSYYFEGETPLAFSAYILDGVVKVPVTADMVEGFDTSAAGEYEAEINYKDTVFTAKYFVEPVPETEIEIREGNVSDEVMIDAVKAILQDLGIKTDALIEDEENEIREIALVLKPFFEMTGADDDLVKDLADILVSPDNNLIASVLNILQGDDVFQGGIITALISIMTDEGNMEALYQLATRVLEDLDASALVNLCSGILYLTTYDTENLRITYLSETDDGVSLLYTGTSTKEEIEAAFAGKDISEAIVQYYDFNAEQLIRSAGGRAMPAFEALTQFLNSFFENTTAEEMKNCISQVVAVYDMLNSGETDAILGEGSETSVKDLVEAANYFGGKMLEAGEPFFDGEVLTSFSYLIRFILGETAYLNGTNNIPEVVAAAYKFIALVLRDLDEDTVAEMLYSVDALMKNDENREDIGRLITAGMNFAVGVWEQLTPSEQRAIKYGNLGIDRVVEYLENWVVRDADEMNANDFLAVTAEFESLIGNASAYSYNLLGKAVIESDYSYSLPYIGRNATQAEIEKVFWTFIVADVSNYFEDGDSHCYYYGEEFLEFLNDCGAEYQITADVTENGLTAITLTYEEFYYDAPIYDYGYESTMRQVVAGTVRLYVYVLDADEFAAEGFTPLVPSNLDLQVYSVYDLSDVTALSNNESFLENAVTPGLLSDAEGKIRISVCDAWRNELIWQYPEAEITVLKEIPGMVLADVKYTLDGTVSYNAPVIFVQKPLDNEDSNHIYEELIAGYEYKVASSVKLSATSSATYTFPMPETGTELDELLSDIRVYVDDLTLEGNTLKILKGYEPKFYLEINTLIGNKTFGENSYDLPVECAGLDVNTLGVQTITLSHPDFPGMEKTYNVEIVSAEELEIGLHMSAFDKMLLLNRAEELIEEGVISDTEELYSYFVGYFGGGVGFKPFSAFASDFYPGLNGNLNSDIVYLKEDASGLEDCTVEFVAYVGMNVQIAAPQVYTCIGTYSEIKENLFTMLGITVEYDPEEWNNTFDGETKQLTLTFKRGGETINTQIIRYKVLEQMDDNSYTLYEPDSDSTYTSGEYGSFLHYSYIESDLGTMYLYDCEVIGYKEEDLGEVELTILIPGTDKYILHTVTVIPDPDYVWEYGVVTGIAQDTENIMIEQNAPDFEIYVSVNKTLIYNGTVHYTDRLIDVSDAGLLNAIGLKIDVQGLDTSLDYGEHTATITVTDIKTGSVYTITQKYTITPPNMLLEAVEGFIGGLDAFLCDADDGRYMAADLAIVFNAENNTTGESINLDVEVSFAASFEGSADDWAMFEIAVAGKQIALYFIEDAGVEQILLGEYVNGGYEWYLIGDENDINGSLVERIRTAISDYHTAGVSLMDYELAEGVTIRAILDLVSQLEMVNVIPFFGVETENGFAVEFTDNATIIEVINSLMTLLPPNYFETEIAKKLIGLCGIKYDGTSGLLSDIADADLVIDFELNGAGALNSLVLEYGLTPKEGFEGWTVGLALAIDNLVTVAPAAKPYEYEALNAEEQPVLKAELTLPMTADPDDDVTLTYYTVIETGETLVNFEQYGKTEKFIYEQENQVIIDTFFLEYLFGMAAERNPGNNYLVSIYKRSVTAPMNAAGETGYLTGTKTPEEIFNSITGVFGSALKDVDSVADYIITWIFMLIGAGAEDVAGATNEIKVMPMCYLYNVLNALFDAAETGVFTAPELYYQGNQWEIIGDYTENPDAPMSVDTFLAFFRTQGWNITDMEDSMFAQMTDQSLTYNAETGTYELQIDDALVTFDIELISYEEFEAALENVRFETTA